MFHETCQLPTAASLYPWRMQLSGDFGTLPVIPLAATKLQQILLAFVWHILTSWSQHESWIHIILMSVHFEGIWERSCTWIHRGKTHEFVHCLTFSPKFAFDNLVMWWQSPSPFGFFKCKTSSDVGICCRWSTSQRWCVSHGSSRERHSRQGLFDCRSSRDLALFWTRSWNNWTLSDTSVTILFAYTR